MKKFLLPFKALIACLLLLCTCNQRGQTAIRPAADAPQSLSDAGASSENPYPSVGAIPLPPGYHRIANVDPFASWLRNIPLKKDRTVYLYDGSPKGNQQAQFAVLDISVGHRDLQQCADAVMRLRAEYQYSVSDYNHIEFYTEQGRRLNFGEWSQRVRLQTSTTDVSRRAAFDEYLATVFMYCSTRTLEKQLLRVARFPSIRAGDVLIKGGAPGHAMQVMDIAEDAEGNLIYLLAQSYMPAQDIHIVKDPMDPAISPWYRADLGNSIIQTPEWEFKTSELRSWPGLP